MKLETVLEHLNSFEKNSFLKIISDLSSNNPKNAAEINSILSSEPGSDIKSADNLNVARVFKLVEPEFRDYVASEFLKTGSQLDVLTDILVRDGNCIMKQDWFSRLYDAEMEKLEKEVKKIGRQLSSDKTDLDPGKKRDYTIYLECLKTAYSNDSERNQENKVTQDELSILITLSQGLGLSQEEAKLINYMVIPLKKHPIDDIINELKNAGVLFYSKKEATVYVADEVVRVLRKIRGKEVADKFFRRVLRQLREPQINLICKKHNIDWRLELEIKIKAIIKEGISFSGVLAEDIYREGTNVSDRKAFINDLCNKKLGINPPLKGVTLEDKIQNLIAHFEGIEADEKVSISTSGYERLLLDAQELIPGINERIRNEFELQPVDVMQSGLLLDYNIKPRDILEILPENTLEGFCSSKDISTRGNAISNILEAYKDSENIYLENYVAIAARDLATLKENGIKIKESEIGIKFEDLTKSIFKLLGFHVDEQTRRTINTKKDKIDILLNVGNNELIIVECKSHKESGYNKFSSVSRQLKAYSQLAQSKQYRVIKSLLVAPEFSDDFVKDCELDYELNLSLIKASTLYAILNGLKASKLEALPFKLLMRDVLIQEERVIKAING